MQHADRPEAASAGDRITRLQHDVQVLIDGDRVLSADGSSLLVALDQALEGLASENARAARAGIETFTRRMQALIKAGILTTGDGRPPIEAAAVLFALLPGAAGTDQKTRRRRRSPANEAGAGRRPSFAERNRDR